MAPGFKALARVQVLIGSEGVFPFLNYAFTTRARHLKTE